MIAEIRSLDQAMLISYSAVTIYGNIYLYRLRQLIH